jgi:hypothetical protein
MTDLDAAALARIVAEQYARTFGPLITPSMQHDLAIRIEVAMQAMLGSERQACAELCRHRRDLWQSSEERRELPEFYRHECRGRANEAQYLADAVEARRSP